MKIQLLLTLLAAFVLAPPSWATDLEDDEKKLKKIAIALGEDAAKAKVLCVCLQDSDALLVNTVGYVRYFVGVGPSDTDTLLAQCTVRSYNDAGDRLLQVCDGIWTTLTK